MINSSEVSAFAGGSGHRDTFSHKIGHNLGLGHSNFGAGGSNNLMTAGSSRSIPNGVGNITPDGFNLSQLTADQQTKLLASPFLVSMPKVVVDTIGSTPFDTDNFFKVNFNSGTSDVFLRSLTVDLIPVNAFFDSTNAAPGLSSSPFRISTSGLSGIAASDITLDGGIAALNGKQTMKLLFADNAFKVGDGFQFCVDVDLFSGIDFFGATPSELIGSLFSFEFSDGLAVKSAIGSDFMASSNTPTDPPTFVSDPTGGPYIPPGTQIDPEDVPGPMPFLGVLAALKTSRQLRRRLRTAAKSNPGDILLSMNT